MEVSVASTSGVTTVGGGTNGGSELSFGITEDLGNGMKAMASTSILHNLQDGTNYVGNTALGTDGYLGTSADTTGGPGSVSSYNSFIGLSGDFGTVKLGQQFSPTFFAGVIGDVAGRAAISNYLAGGLTGQVANAFNYSSPSISGLTFVYQKMLSTASAIATTEGRGYNAYSVTYANGGLTAAYAVASNSAYNGVAYSSETVAGASYDFGVAKVHAGMSTAKGLSTAQGVGISAPVGNVVLAYGYQTQGTVNKQQYGATYMFSKKTSAYIAQGKYTTTTTLVGLKQTF